MHPLTDCIRLTDIAPAKCQQIRYRSEFTAASRGFPATAWLSCCFSLRRCHLYVVKCDVCPPVQDVILYCIAGCWRLYNVYWIQSVIFSFLSYSCLLLFYYNVLYAICRMFISATKIVIGIILLRKLENWLPLHDQIVNSPILLRITSPSLM